MAASLALITLSPPKLAASQTQIPWLCLWPMPTWQQNLGRESEGSKASFWWSKCPSCPHLSILHTKQNHGFWVFHGECPHKWDFHPFGGFPSAFEGEPLPTTRNWCRTRGYNWVVYALCPLANALDIYISLSQCHERSHHPV